MVYHCARIPAPVGTRRYPMRPSVICAAAIALSFLSGCAFEEKSRADFERHNNSILRTSYQDSAMLVFEARAGAAFPDDSESAEELRMRENVGISALASHLLVM